MVGEQQRSSLEERAMKHGEYSRIIHEMTEGKVLSGEKLLKFLEETEGKDRFNMETCDHYTNDHAFTYMTYFLIGYTRISVLRDGTMASPKDVTFAEAQEYARRRLEEETRD